MVHGLDLLRDRFDAVLFDLDGTLLDGSAQLTARTVAAVRRLVDHGFTVLLCTGRSVAGTRPHRETLGLDTPMVTYNGSWIGSGDGPPEHHILIPDVHVEGLAAAELAAGFFFRHHAEVKYTVMTDHPDHGPVAQWYSNVVHAGAHHELPARDLIRISMFYDERDLPIEEVHASVWGAVADATRAALRLETFPLRIFPSYEHSTMVLFEVQGHSRGKAEAFEWLASTRGIPASRTIAVGDHGNDLTMLEAAGLAVTPANGVDEARRRAHVVIGHHAEEGVAAWIEQGAPHPSPDAGRTPEDATRGT
jgi:hypothetical protein